ncbi:MAG: pirin family protein [Gammaproteobacteria bacterium]|nr:pirin family protein [Gammaproteobacteria bacterium]
MLDECGSDRLKECVAGFPPHLYHAFQTVTYMLEGHTPLKNDLRHRRHVKSGGV